eukprot:13218424-Alexandrium_andersonii.AAC.1
MLLQPVFSLPAGQLVGQPDGDASHQALVLSQACQGLVRHKEERRRGRAGKAQRPVGHPVPDPRCPLLRGPGALPRGLVRV